MHKRIFTCCAVQHGTAEYDPFSGSSLVTRVGRKMAAHIFKAEENRFTPIILGAGQALHTAPGFTQ